MTWYDDGGNKPPHEPPPVTGWVGRVLCAHCGQPVADTSRNSDGERFFHGACYALEFPPEHPEEWPKPITQTPDPDTEWFDHHGR